MFLIAITNEYFLVLVQLAVIIGRDWCLTNVAWARHSRSIEIISKKENRTTQYQIQILSALWKASQVYVKKLWLTQDQQAQINNLYNSNTLGFHVVEQEYNPLFPEQQVTTMAFLSSHGLDSAAQASIDNRWSSQWVSVTGKGDKVTK